LTQPPSRPRERRYSAGLFAFAFCHCPVCSSFLARVMLSFSLPHALVVFLSFVYVSGASDRALLSPVSD
jgi:hypothetical protein